MIEHQRRRQLHICTNSTLQLIAQLDCAERVNTRLHQWRIRVDGAASGALYHIENGLK